MLAQKTTLPSHHYSVKINVLNVHVSGVLCFLNVQYVHIIICLKKLPCECTGLSCGVTDCTVTRVYEPGIGVLYKNSFRPPCKCVH